MQFSERVTCTTRQAAEATGLGLTKIGEAIRSGRIKSKLIDGRRVLDVRSVLEMVRMDDAAGYTPSLRGFAVRPGSAVKRAG